MKIRIILSLLCVNFLSSCAITNKDDANEINPSGVYSLISVDGGMVPTTTLHGKQEVFVQSGTFTINSDDDTCISEVVFGPAPDRMQTRIVHATYTQKVNQLEMRWKGAGRTKGIVEGDIFTMNNEGMIFKYQKQP